VTNRTTSRKIQPADIEAKFREIQDQVDSVAGDGRKQATLLGIVGAVILLILIYMMGQKAGKKKSTVLEIRRL
jgi:hypothetical protein